MENSEPSVDNMVFSVADFLPSMRSSDYQKKLGVEIEFQVLDANFKESNRADEIIALAKKHNLSVIGECSKNMLELVSSPGTEKEVLIQLSKDYLLLSQLAESIGLLVIPLDYPLNPTFRPEIRATKKFEIQKEIIGDNFEYAGLVCGTHIHFDLNGNSTDDVKSNLLKLVDPLVSSLTSTVTAIHKGTPIQNWRLYSYRNLVYKDNKLNGGVTPLTPTFSDFIIQLNELTELFKQKYQGKEDINLYVKPLKGIWGSLRLKPEIQTIELRSAGAIPDFVFLNLLVQFLNRLEYLSSQSNHETNDVLLHLFGTKGLKKSSKQLQKISNESVISGLDSSLVQNYAQAFLDYFNDEQLQSLYEQLVKRKTVRDFIISSTNMSSAEKYSLLYALTKESAHQIGYEHE